MLVCTTPFTYSPFTYCQLPDMDFDIIANVLKRVHENMMLGTSAPYQ